MEPRTSHGKKVYRALQTKVGGTLWGWEGSPDLSASLRPSKSKLFPTLFLVFSLLTPLSFPSALRLAPRDVAASLRREVKIS